MPNLPEEFLSWLGGERRAAAKTLETYGRDVLAFLAFCSGHVGGEVDLKMLGELRQADFRAWIASEAKAGAGNATRARKLSAIKTFFRFLKKRHGVEGTALALISRPRPKRPLPKALTPVDAKRVARDIGEASDTAMIQARDTALMMLLYGAGLRINEALSLDIRHLPPADDALRVTGKGNKQRIVPLLQVVRDAIATYLRLHPNPAREAPLFVGVAELPAAERAAGARHAACAAALLCHPPPRRRGGFTLDPGTAGACESLNDAALHGRGYGAADGCMAEDASKS